MQQVMVAEDISFVEVRKRFGFRSIRVGRWVTREEQAKAAVLFHQALLDLMAILQGPESLISLRGTLSLQYGIGGRLGVSAHYSPLERCFSLAKNAGAGSVAHEWFHALDHYLGQQAFNDLPSTHFASRAWLEDLPMRKHALNQCLGECFRAILLDESDQGSSQQMQASIKMDNA